MLGTWDDHDFGMNNVGREWTEKQFSQIQFLDFLDEAADSVRRQREGVYESYVFRGLGKGRASHAVSSSAQMPAVTAVDSEASTHVQLVSNHRVRPSSQRSQSEFNPHLNSLKSGRVCGGKGW